MTTDKSYEPSASYIVGRWYESINVYEFGSEEFENEALLFTQVIWKRSTELGMSWRKNKDGDYFVVANYKPRGNVVGQFVRNVPPPVKLHDSNESTDVSLAEDKEVEIKPDVDEKSVITENSETKETGEGVSSKSQTQSESIQNPSIKSSNLEDNEVKKSRTQRLKDAFRKSIDSAGSRRSSLRKSVDSGASPDKGSVKSGSKNTSIVLMLHEERVDSAVGDDFNTFAREGLKAHNKYRRNHGVPPLKLSVEVSIRLLDDSSYKFHGLINKYFKQILSYNCGTFWQAVPKRHLGWLMFHPYLKKIFLELDF